MELNQRDQERARLEYWAAVRTEAQKAAQMITKTQPVIYRAPNFQIFDLLCDMLGAKRKENKTAFYAGTQIFYGPGVDAFPHQIELKDNFIIKTFFTNGL